MGQGGGAVNVLPHLHSLVSHPALVICCAVGLAGAAMDLDHLVEGLSRDTHLPVVILAWCCLGGYVALGRRRRRAVVLGVRT